MIVSERAKDDAKVKINVEEDTTNNTYLLEPIGKRQYPVGVQYPKPV